MASTVCTRPFRSVGFDALVAVAVLGLAALDLRALGWPALLIGAGTATALLGRRIWPRAVFGAAAGFAGLLSLVLVLTGDGRPRPLPAQSIGVLVALYGVVKYGPRLRDGTVAGVVTIAGTVGVVLATDGGRHTRVLPGLGLLAVIVVAVWLFGLYRRTHRLYVASLRERAAAAERERGQLARIAVAEERASIARELHDVVAHSLSVMIV